MADSDERDLSVLAKIISTYVTQRQQGKQPKYLYLPPGGIVSLADDLAALCPSVPHPDGFPTFCGMRIIERPELAAHGWDGFVSENPLDAH
jgi:hypothetical protein